MTNKTSLLLRCVSCVYRNNLHFERYLSLDSYALVDAAPRESVVSVLDICCGSGVQGLVALRHYAKEAMSWKMTSDRRKKP